MSGPTEGFLWLHGDPARHAEGDSIPLTDSGPQYAPGTPTYSCGGCDHRWPGISRCHCGACHRTFGGIELFDAHRRKGACVDPETITTTPKSTGQPIRVMYLTNGIWQGSETGRKPPMRRT